MIQLEDGKVEQRRKTAGLPTTCITAIYINDKWELIESSLKRRWQI